jgi:hypothetical protein
MRAGAAWETVYAYDSVREFITTFAMTGLRVVEVKRFPCVDQYTKRLPIIGMIGRLYDDWVERLSLRFLMGQVCVVMRHPGTD